MGRPYIDFKRMVTDQPWIISSAAVEVAAYLNGLAAVDIKSNTAGKEWGFAINSVAGGVSGGTAYLVSTSAKRHIETMA